MEGYKRYYDSIEPSVSDEELLNAVLCRKAEKKMSENKHKGRIRTVAAAAAAVAVTVGTTLAVGAARGWDISAIFGRVFSADTTQTEKGFDFERYGKAMDDWYRGEDFDIHVIGAAADSDSVFVLLDAVGEGDWSDVINTSCSMNMSGNFSGESDPDWQGTSCDAYDVEGNAIRYLLSWNTSSTEGKTLSFRPEAISCYDLNEEPMRLNFGSAEISVEVDFPVCEDRRVYEIGKEFEYCGQTFRVDRVELTPFRYAVYMTDPNGLSQLSFKRYSEGIVTDGVYNEDFESNGAILKDGTRLTARFMGVGISGSDDEKVFGGFICPVDLDEISELMIAPDFVISLE